jgi:hypothetical protein
MIFSGFFGPLSFWGPLLLFLKLWLHSIHPSGMLARFCMLKYKGEVLVAMWIIYIDHLTFSKKVLLGLKNHAEWSCYP